MISPAPLSLEYVCTISVSIGERKSLGYGPLGDRFIIDLLGGLVEGPALNGIVLCGGQDRQVIRADGIKELDARYEIQTYDGEIISVHNSALVDEFTPSGRSVRSWLHMQASAGKYEWLNRIVFVSRVDRSVTKENAVRVTIYAVR